MAKIDRQIAIAMRYEGKTLMEIADHFGVSYQAVQKALKHSIRSRKNGEIFEHIPYKGLYEWMKLNPTVSVPRLGVIMGMSYCHATQEKVGRLLRGQYVALPKRAYDRLIAHTGMTYEQLFELRDGFKEDFDG